MPIIQEGSTKINASEGKISKKLEVFYNPVMKFNRDLSVLLLESIDKEEMQICDLLAGSGIRSIRFLKELPKNKIKSIFINDHSTDFLILMKNHFALNSISEKDITYYKTDKDYTYDITESKNNTNNKFIVNKKINVTCEEANQLLLKTNGFDYIEIDPFGTPNPFLDNSIKMLSRDGILAVTATDTAALAGTSPKAGQRKYWATPLHNALMHEVGVRILIRKIQLIGAQYDKALIPILSYAQQHYYRIFFRCTKGKQVVDTILKQHQYLRYKKDMSFSISHFPLESALNAGPLYSGELADEKLIREMIKNTSDASHKKFLETLKVETQLNIVGFHQLHAIAKHYKIGQLPTTEKVIQQLQKKKYVVTHTIFDPVGIKTNVPIKEIVLAMKP